MTIPVLLLSQVSAKYQDNLRSYAKVTLDITSIKDEVKRSPLKNEMGNNRTSNSNISLALPNQIEEHFSVIEAPILDKRLAVEYPEIKSYIVQGIDSPEANGRINVSPYGIYGYISLSEGMMVLEPLVAYSDSKDYISYYEHDIINVSGSCEALDEDVESLPIINNPSASTRDNSCFQNGDILRTYDLVVTCTGEYYGLNNAGGGDADVIAAIINKIAAINVPYERDMAITLNVVETLLNDDPTTDPVTAPTLTSQSMGETAQYIQDNATVASYDLGHGFHEINNPSQGWAGIAGLGVVCREDIGNGSMPVTGVSAAQKSRGYTYQNQAFPTSNTVMIHEFGHMFSCNHANYGCNSNNACQRYEPGRGASIMSTGANCTADDFFANRTDYFGISSLQAIYDFVNNDGVVFNSQGAACTPVAAGAGWGVCSTNTPISNNLPSSDANSQNIDGKTIPANTPFILTGTGADADGIASLTYNWEQYDSDYTGSDLPDDTGNSTTAPLFRSFPPSTTGNVRTCPQINSILNGSTLLTGETLPLVSRLMVWRLVVRDNNVGGGGIACDEIAINVEDTGAAFEVTSQSAATAWAGNETETISWNVSDTDINPINCTNVDILFSSDGGLTYPTTLLANTPNDGMADITTPNISTTEGRIMIVCSDNIFFNINSENITISVSLPVELIRFEGQKRGKSVQLLWTTATEENNDYFMVERSNDGINFEFLLRRKGFGTSLDINHYEVFDNKPLNGTNYYRLIQVDYDGRKNTESKVVAVDFISGSSISVIPNPVQNEMVRISYLTEQSGDVNLSIYDLNGRILYRNLVRAEIGNNQFDLSLPNLANGVYIIKTAKAENLQTTRFIKTK